ncbi:MAG TPA: selenocysteine-specific translation elongation factor, partial [Solirubrobacteraceae bacterium]|nr:selenocysteine-specific translation elongation factor [Solirubrobacteraceae bacterium]
MSAAPLTLGTAGHIDHGKTALVRALTGVNTDRLPQERDRGISIELGYAQLTLPSGRTMSVVDAPGHERFVRTMVAGATGIDLYLMTVAADDGVMPQTQEHALVLRALGIEHGVIAVTKSDLADPELAMIEASELLPHASEVIPVSARTGAGMDELRLALDRLAAAVPSRADGAGLARLHIDRVFTIRGAGTVVTGTLWAGSISRGDELALLPSGRRVRVRGVQVHDEALERAGAGQRVAVNLVGTAVAEVQRGEVLAAIDSAIRPTYLIDARLETGDADLEAGDRVQVHHGTRETPARAAWLGGDFWQLRLERPLVPIAGDRLVIRQIAPPDTLGGGIVLDPHPRKHGPSRQLMVRLEKLSRGEKPDETPTGPKGSARGQPDGPDSRQHRPPVRLSPGAEALERQLRAAGSEPPLDAELDPDDLAALREAGRAVRVSKNLHYHPAVLADIRARIVALASQNGGAITLAQLRDELGTSRKFAQALLEHFDSERLTIRRGEAHILRSRGAP